MKRVIVLATALFIIGGSSFAQKSGPKEKTKTCCTKKDCKKDQKCSCKDCNKKDSGCCKKQSKDNKS